MIKTKQIFVLTVAAAGLVLASSAAQATPTLSIIWQSTGTATLVSPTASATIVADIVIATNTLTVRGIFISIEFDVSELQAISMARAVRLAASSLARRSCPSQRRRYLRWQESPALPMRVGAVSASEPCQSRTAELSPAEDARASLTETGRR
jgi:hypothetical protein